MRLLTILPGEALAYRTVYGWAFAGDYFHSYEGLYLITRMSFASGAVRFEKRHPEGWAVIRGTEILPLVIETEAV